MRAAKVHWQVSSMFFLNVCILQELSGLVKVGGAEATVFALGL